MVYKSRNQSLKDRSSGALPKALFMILAIIGCMLIWLIKWLNMGQLINVLVPVSLILSYCLTASKVSSFYLREDQISDNAYYMGFLYTLSSLAYTLFKFSDGGSSPEDIISSFGVALWSTIVGIALRVFYSQMRQDPNDIEQDARVKIAQTASNLTSELNQASLAFNNYRRNLQQSIEESFSDTNKAVSSALIESVEKFSAAAEGMGEKIQSAFEEFSTYSKKMNDVSSKTVKAIESLNQRIENIEAPENMISQKLNSVFDDIEINGKKLSSLTEKQVGYLESLASGSYMLVEAIKSLSAQSEAVKTYSQDMIDGANSTNILIDKISTISKSLDVFSHSLSALLDSNSKSTVAVSQHADELQTQLERSRRYTEETHQSLASMVSTLSEKLQ